MGNEVFNEDHPYQYAVFKGEKKPGESRILVHPQGMTKKNYIDRYTQIEAIEYYKEKRPDSNFLGTREYNPTTKKYGKYVWKSWTQIYDLAKLFLYGLTKFNLCPEIVVDAEKNEKMKLIGFCCRTREEYMVSSFGCQMDTITIVTIYDTLGLNSIEFILKQTELTTILTESKDLELILKLKESNKLVNVKNIIYIHCNEEKENLEEIKKKLTNYGINLIKYETIMETGKKCVEEKDEEILNKNYRKILPDDVYLICYTSGTTDNPKGVMVSSRSLLLTPNFMYNIGYHLTGEDRHLSFLPLGHLMEHMVFSVNLVYGVQVGYYNGDVSKLEDDYQALQPTYLCSVPRIYERINLQVKESVSKKGELYKKLFEKALEIKIYNYKKYGKLTHAFFDPIFFNDIKKKFGGKINYMLSGSAAMKPDLIERLTSMLGCPFVQGYGQTEGGGTSFFDSMYDTYEGTIGGIENSSELKLIDLPEFNYLTTDVNPITRAPEPKGEVCYRGCFFKGYFKNKEETDRVIDKDGWLHSGDVGVILTKNGNRLKLIDRAKNLFKLSQGEYIAPDKVQNILVNSKYVYQICIDGQSQYSYAVAIVVPHLNECIKFLKENKKMGDIDYDKISIDDLCGNKIMESEIVKDCDIVGRKLDLKGFELPKKIRIINEAFSVENNLLTPNLKLKSKNIRIKYNNLLKSMYEENI